MEVCFLDFHAVSVESPARNGIRSIPLERTIATRRFEMKISARNRLKGKVAGIVKGATTSHVRIDIGGGVIVTASITNEAVDELKLTVGKQAYAVVKASDVMVGVD
jgi:molybdopterin-binding protein